jgi:hypothetical protein
MKRGPNTIDLTGWQIAITTGRKRNPSLPALSELAGRIESETRMKALDGNPDQASTITVDCWRWS